MEAQRIENNRKKMQYIMDQAPVFGQLYIHIDKLGENDEIGARQTKEDILGDDATSFNERTSPDKNMDGIP